MKTGHVLAGLVMFGLAAAALAQTAPPPAAYAGKPYQLHPQTIPGRVEAEFYDTGGEGVAYHDSDAGNNGSGK
jgi:hypothetical protein